MTKLVLKAAPPVDETAEPVTQDIEVRAYHTPEAMAAPFRSNADGDPCDGSAGTSPRPRRPMQRSPLVWLWTDGVLPTWSLRAGQEIARVYAVITSAAGGRVTASYGERLGRVASADDVAPSLRAAYADRYVPWRQWAGAEAATPGRSLADVTLMLCVEELALAAIRRRVGLHQDTIKRRVQRSLHWYAVNAGWVLEKNR